ncbi:hypothetical protein ABK040_010313 [Willaertia magna]
MNNYISTWIRAFLLESKVDGSLLLKEFIEHVCVMVFYPIICFFSFAALFAKLLLQIVMARGMMHSYSNYDSVIITGGSSGLGAALARNICMDWKAGFEKATNKEESTSKVITLVGRDDERLKKVRDDINSEVIGAFASKIKIETRKCDITNQKEISQIITERNYDLVISNAATDSIQLREEIKDEEDVIYQLFKENVMGMLHVMLSSIKQARKLNTTESPTLTTPPKKLLVISSVVAYHGKSGGSYGCTKTAIFELIRYLNFAMSSACFLKDMQGKYCSRLNQMKIQVAFPSGIYDTKMGSNIENLEKLPGSKTAMECARLIKNGLDMDYDFIDINHPLMFVAFKILNALPMSVEQFVTSIVQKGVVYL